MAKPVIKWAGGKTQLLSEIKKRMPKSYNKYYEPFIGGGALFFDLEPKRAVINDFNNELVNLYKVIKDAPEALILRLKAYEAAHSENYYYATREDFNSRINTNDLGVEDAAQMIYLNKMGFNGLYRVNGEGYLNVPSGKKTRCSLYQEENIFLVSKTLQNTKILNGDFEKACKYMKKGDFVFFDSPYYDTFDTYQKGGFSTDDHIRLAKLFKKLSKRGIYCMLTNSNTDFIKSLYKGYNIDIVKVKRMINCDGKKRTGEEVIITNYNTEDEE